MWRIMLTILIKVKISPATVVITPKRGHRAISHVCNLDTFLENNISNGNSNEWSNCNNPDLSFLLTLIETTNVIYQSKVVIYVMCIGCRAGGTKGMQGQLPFKI